jgi:DNA polymerase V
MSASTYTAQIYRVDRSRSCLLTWIRAPRPVAGFKNPTEEAETDALSLDGLLVKNPVATFFLRVTGDSMEEAGIHDGDYLVVDRSRTPWSGSIVVATLRNASYLCVKEFSNKDGRVELLSRHGGNKYPPIVLSDESDGEIWGVVTATIRKF